MLKGRLVNDMPMVRITPEMLDIDPDGVSCTDCALVTLDKALTAEEIVESSVSPTAPASAALWHRKPPSAPSPPMWPKSK